MGGSAENFVRLMNEQAKALGAEVASGRFGRGDISIADPSVDHRPTAENTVPCIGFAVTDAPLRLTGSLRQRLGDILSI